MGTLSLCGAVMSTACGFVSALEHEEKDEHENEEERIAVPDNES